MTKPVVSISASDKENPMIIMETVIRALKKSEAPVSVIEDYKLETMTGDYGNLLRVTEEYTHLIFI